MLDSLNGSVYASTFKKLRVNNANNNNEIDVVAPTTNELIKIKELGIM